MSFPLKILVGISVLFSLFMIIGFFLPSNYKVTKTVMINAAHGKVYPYLNDLEEWPRWTVWNTENDETLKVKYGVKSKGEGASMRWNGDKMGNGRLQIKESYPLEGVKFVMHLQDDRILMNGELKITPEMETQQTKIDWTCSGKLDHNPARRYMGLMMNRMLENDLENGLQKLKKLVESEQKLMQGTLQQKVE